MGDQPADSDAQPEPGLQSTAIVAVLLFVAVVGGVANTPAIPHLVWFATTGLICCILGYVAGAGILLATIRVHTRSSVKVLAVGMLASAAFAGALFLTIPSTDRAPPIVAAGSQTAMWLHVFWILVFAATGCTYASYRRCELRAPLHRDRGLRSIVIAAILLAAGLMTIAFGAADGLPRLIADGNFVPLRTSGVGYALAVISALAGFLVWRVDPANPIGRAVAISLLAMTLDTIVTLLSPHRYTASYYSGRMLACGGVLVLLLAAVGRMTRAYHRLPDAEAALSRTETFALRQSRRLAAVWRISHDVLMSDAERLQAILDAGTASMRPGRPFYGKISHREGDDLVVDLVSSHSAEVAADAPFLWEPNERVPFASTLSNAIREPGQSMVYNNIADFQAVTGRSSASARNWQSAVRASFAVANITYFLAFASTETTTDDPFTEDDLAFIDVLAAFITAQAQQSRQLAQLRYQIEHDLLTALPNRASFRSAALKPISAGVPCAIAVIDLDRFREINETFGHMVGDALLVEIAAGLRKAARPGDIVARMHGDTFGLLIDDVHNDSDIELRIQPFRDVFNHPIITGDRTGKEAVRVNASIGIAFFPQDADTFDDLLARADTAVDAAKQSNRGSISFFNPSLQESIDRRRLMHTELVHAVEHGELVLHYQPAIDLATGEVVGAEALVRWQHPDHGIVPPGAFIPFAEKNGLIRPIGRWVLHRAVADMAGFREISRGFKCYVNLSGHQLGDLEFVSEFRELLAGTPRAIDHMAVEITETVAMQDVGRTLDALSILREMGIVIALDDFGTGYSSLSYLKRFPIDVIKIDQSFVAGLPLDQHDVALIETLLDVSRRFGFRTLAEGIESQEQLDWLRARGCSYGQGYFIARPMAFDALKEWIDRARLTTR